MSAPNNTTTDMPPAGVHCSWLTTEQAAARLQVCARTLRRMRQRGDGPPFVQVSPRLTRYRADDINAWAAEQVRTKRAVFVRSATGTMHGVAGQTRPEGREQKQREDRR